MGNSCFRYDKINHAVRQTGGRTSIWSIILIGGTFASMGSVLLFNIIPRFRYSENVQGEGN